VSSGLVLRKYAADAAPLWAQPLELRSEDLGDPQSFRLAVDTDGEVLVTGVISPVSLGDELQRELGLLWRFTTDGALDWSTQLDPSVTPSGAAAFGADRSVYVAGWTRGADGANTGTFVRRLGAKGETVWSHRLGTGASQFVNALGLAPDGDLYAAGTAGVGYLTRLDQDGTPAWRARTGGIGGVVDLAVGDDGNVHLIGWAMSQEDVVVRAYPSGEAPPAGDASSDPSSAAWLWALGAAGVALLLAAIAAAVHRRAHGGRPLPT
jgi:hypothetical protein